MYTIKPKSLKDLLMTISLTWIVNKMSVSRSATTFWYLLPDFVYRTCRHYAWRSMHALPFQYPTSSRHTRTSRPHAHHAHNIHFFKMLVFLL